MSNHKKYFIASVFLASNISYSQTSVSLYGIMDMGLANISSANNAATNQLRSGNLLTSRFGFRGSEDIGSGVKVNFVLEGGITADTGATSTPFFNRQSWLGISSSKYGDIRLGRMLPITSDLFAASIHSSYLGNTTAAIDGGAVGSGSSLSRFNNMFGGTRLNNTIKYQTPKYSGFSGHIMTSLGEVEGSSSAGRSTSLGGSYNTSNIEAGLAYHEKECSSKDGCNISQGKDNIIGLGLAYKNKGARYAILLSKQNNALNVKGNDAEVASIIGVIPSGKFVFGAGLQYLNDKTILNQDTTQYNIGINYLLSKRTQLYTLLSHQNVSNNGKAGMYSITSKSNKQTQFSLGVAHRF